jgi:4'-phosphopantetheinyl transferase
MSTRWAVNWSEWEPSEEEWRKTLSLVETEEQQRIERFVRPLRSGPLRGRHNPDAKRSLVGRLLLRKLAHDVLGLAYEEIKFARTSEGKPYLLSTANALQSIQRFPCFNFNVSHHADWVVLASEPHALVGVDVMDQAQQPGGSVEFFSNMRRCFTEFEWSNILRESSEDFQLKQFFVHWTLKESYIKAIGIGLGLELQRVEFTLDNQQNPRSATMRLDGRLQNDWIFKIEFFAPRHIAATALGPSSEAVPSYRATLPVCTPWRAETYVHSAFSILSAADLLA